MLPEKNCSSLEPRRHHFEQCSGVSLSGDLWYLSCPCAAAHGLPLVTGERAAALGGVSRPLLRGPQQPFLCSLFRSGLLCKLVSLAPSLFILFSGFLCPQIKLLGFPLFSYFLLLNYKMDFPVRFFRTENDQVPLISEIRDHLRFSVSDPDSLNCGFVQKTVCICQVTVRTPRPSKRSVRTVISALSGVPGKLQPAVEGTSLFKKVQKK